MVAWPRHFHQVRNVMVPSKYTTILTPKIFAKEEESERNIVLRLPVLSCDDKHGVKMDASTTDRRVRLRDSCRAKGVRASTCALWE